MTPKFEIHHPETNEVVVSVVLPEKGDITKSRLSVMEEARKLAAIALGRGYENIIFASGTVTEDDGTTTRGGGTTSCNV